MSTQLQDLMHDAVQDTHPDLDALVLRARKRGLGIRRRRQSLSLVGAALAVTGIVVGSSQLAAGPGPDGTVATAPSPAPSVDATGPISGRTVAAGLREAIGAQMHATSDAFSDFKGQSGHEAYAELHYQTSGPGGYSLVGINVQPDFDSPYVYQCRARQLSCRMLHPSKGATLITYEERTPSPDGLGIRVTADLLRADGVRVVASSANGEQLAGNRWRITRERPPLSATQLYLVVSEPWWGPRMDQRFAEAGARLSPYTDLDADRGDWIHGSPSANP